MTPGRDYPRALLRALGRRLVRPDGVLRFVRSRGHVQCYVEGNPLRRIGTMLDMTERVEAISALTLTEAGVARLVAEGHTNGEVAESFAIAPRTVQAKEL